MAFLHRGVRGRISSPIGGSNINIGSISSSSSSERAVASGTRSRGMVVEIVVALLAVVVAISSRSSSHFVLMGARTPQAEGSSTIRSSESSENFYQTTRLTYQKIALFDVRHCFRKVSGTGKPLITR
jgi:hypothetical protein